PTSSSQSGGSSRAGGNCTAGAYAVARASRAFFSVPRDSFTSFGSGRRPLRPFFPLKSHLRAFFEPEHFSAALLCDWRPVFRTTCAEISPTPTLTALARRLAVVAVLAERLPVALVLEEPAALCFRGAAL